MVTVTSGVERFLQEIQSENARPDESASTAEPAPPAPAAEPAPAVEPAKINIELGYTPFPKQQEFHKSPAKYRLFGGAAGPGKSKALLMEAVIQAHEHANANTLLLRRTFPELEQTLLHYFRRDVPRDLYTNFQESKHLVTWKNGSTTRFGYCQNEHDVYQYQGAEFLFIGIDELTLFTLRQWQFLTSRNRCPVPGAFPCMAAATNPGNIGHAWVKSLWIDKQPAPGMENPAEYDPSDYDFIPARVTDNPIYAGDEHYLKTLRALPSHLRRAFLDGDWDVFAGQYFDRFDYSRHVIRAEQTNLQPWSQRWISVDWGFEHPSAAYWHASVPGSSAAASGFSSVGAQQEGLPGRRNDRAPEDSVRGAREIIEPGRSDAPGAASRTVSQKQDSATGIAPVECGGLPPLSAAPACRDVLHASASANESRNATSTATSLDAELTAHSNSDVTSAGEASLTCNTAAASRRTPHGAETSRDRANNPQSRVVTYREYVTRRTPPRELAREIIARSLLSSRDSVASSVATGAAGSGFVGRSFSSDINDRPQGDTSLPKAPFSSGPRERTSEFFASSREKIDAIYLSPDAFARRTDEASIAEQMGDVFAAAGFPRPIPADDDRVGGWMLMYQMLDADERGPQVPGKGSLGDPVWRITDNCIELLRTLPNLVRDTARVEDVEKMDGDDPADAARYGLKSRYGAHLSRGSSDRRMPLADRLAARVVSADPTIRAMQARKAQIEETRGTGPVKFPHRRRYRDNS